MRRRGAKPLAFCAGLAVLLMAGDARAQTQAGPGSGSIEGRVELHLPAPRRTASRYPGTPVRTNPVQPIPAMVFIQGTVPGTPARADGAVAIIAQRDTAFVPAALVFQVGTTVRFPNQDVFFHNVFSYSGAARFDLGRYPRGESKDVRFDEPGLVKIYCEVHEFMRAAAAVIENPFGVVVDESGDFRIDGIPAGRYTLVVWHPDLEAVERTVVVPDGGTVRMDVALR